MRKNVILHGDCLEVLREIPDNSIDAVCCDPPYGLSKEPDIVEVLTKWLAGEDYHHRGGGFMGASWDSFVPGPSIWREVYRVLKPGAHVLCFAGTRTQDLMTISLRIAGFEIRDVIEWLYFSGFPKSMDVGKAFDRRRKEDLPAIYAVTKFIAEARDRAGKTNRDIDEFMGTNGMADHWTTQRSQPRVPRLDQWYKLKEFLGMPDEMDAEVWRLNGRKGKPGDAWFEREKIGEREVVDIRNGHGRSYGSALFAGEKTGKITWDITAPATDLAKQWDGWKAGTLKPAHEPIILCRKPIEKNVAYNVEKYGTGAINVDGCRIPTDETDKAYFKVNHEPTESDDRKVYGFATYDKLHKRGGGNEKCRFPANCITTEPDVFYSKYFNVTPEPLCKKASKKDRLSTWDGRQIEANRHPTVKPVELMAWLCRLICPPGGVVLDPFAGSGSTLVAAKREGFSYIGIEKEAEYVEIARTRVCEEGEKIEEGDE